MTNDDAFKFTLTGNRDVPFLGYNSITDPTDLSPQYLVQGSKNVFLDNNGNIEVRPGLKMIGALETAEDGVVASYEFETAQGATLPVRVLATSLMQYRYLGIWHDLMQFDLSRFIFAPWWDDSQKKNLLIMVNGNHNLYAWAGAITTFSSQVLTASRAIWSITAGTSTSGTYAINDIITIGGTGTGATLLVTAVDTGIPSGLKLLTQGSGYTVGAAIPTTGGSGLNFTVTINEVKDIYSVTKQGSTTWSEDGFLVSDIEATGLGLTLDVGAMGQAFTINGNTYHYFGGEDTTALKGVDGPIVGTSGDLIISALITTLNTPSADTTNDFIVTLNNQLIVGSYTSKIIYISFDEDYTRFTQSNDLISGDPDFAVLDEFPTGMVTKGESIYVFAGNSSTYLLTPNTPVPIEQPIGGGNDALVVCNVEKQVGAGKSAALAMEFITTVGTDILYLAQDHQLRQLGTVRNITTQKTPSLSKAVKQELIDEDFTGGMIRAVDEFVYCTAPISGRTYLYQIRDDVDPVGNLTAQRYWQPFQEWNLSRIAVIDGVTYGYSSSTPQLYQLWDTDQWHDDSKQGVPSPYECRARFAYQNNGLKTGQVSFNMCYYEGYIAPNSELTGRIRFDYLGGTKNSGQSGVQDIMISSLTDAPTLFIGESVAELGVSQIGTEEIGGTTNELQGYPKFRVIQDVEPTDVFEYQVELYSYAADSRWQIKCFGTNPTQSVNNPVFLRKT